MFLWRNKKNVKMLWMERNALYQLGIVKALRTVDDFNLG